MNVSLNFNVNSAKTELTQLNEQQAKRLQKELDDMFYSGIKTPQDVIVAYEKIAEYIVYSGKNYEITIKENTIV
jgi:hypothetical protein